MRCIKRGKESFSNKLGLRWKEVEIVMIVAIKMVLINKVVVLPPRVVEIPLTKTIIITLN
jgi:hypothetical protein